MDLGSIGQLIVQLGLPSALVLFFTYQSWLREQRLSSRIDELERTQRAEIVDMNEKMREALEQNTAALRALSRNHE